MKNGKSQRRGKVSLESSLLLVFRKSLIKTVFQLNLIGRLQLSTERSQQEDNQSIVQLRILRTQEAIIKIMKVRKRMNNAALQVSEKFQSKCIWELISLCRRVNSLTY